MGKKYFHGQGKHSSYFEGWYLKHQNLERTAAFIPAVHADENGKWTASIQVVLESGAWYFTYPIELCEISHNMFYINIAGNIFTEKGICIDIENREISIHGKIMYSRFQNIKNDIMGFFRFFPFMQCNHGVISMAHGLKGSLTVNGELLDFTGGCGYIETDWGTSFPKEYLWTQSELGMGYKVRNSIMVSAADIPFMGMRFQGCICAIHYNSREYRIATYCGARITDYREGSLVLKQGSIILKVTRMGEQPFDLRAPQQGSMVRTIKESPSCCVRYQMWQGREFIFDVVSNRASFEQVISAKDQAG